MTFFPQVQMMFLHRRSFSKSCRAINEHLRQGWRLLSVSTDRAYFERYIEAPTTSAELSNALTFLARLHTSTDAATGFNVRVLTSPNDWPNDAAAQQVEA